MNILNFVPYQKLSHRKIGSQVVELISLYEHQWTGKKTSMEMEYKIMWSVDEHRTHNMYMYNQYNIHTLSCAYFNCL